MSTSNEQIRKQRIQFVRELRLKDLYQRSHTSTGVWRRNDLTEDTEPAPKVRISTKSLANLTKGRRVD